MRTTITLDDDVAAQLKSERRKSGRTLRQTVNDVLRLGLTAAREPKKRKAFVLRDVGFRLGIEFESAADLIERLEGPSHK